jgi:predicted O-linked N-acetylglucosamine transferase (SPINDLY family)
MEQADASLEKETAAFIKAIRCSDLQQRHSGHRLDLCFDPSHIEQHLAGAMKLMNQGYPRTAELLLAALLELRPTCEGAMLKLAELYEQEDAYTKTVFCANALEKRGINHDEVVYQHAFALFKLERHDQALETILPLYIGSQEPRVLRLCGLILKSLGLWSDAIEVLERVVTDSPGDVHSLRALSELYSNLGDYSKSLNAIKRIREDSAELCDQLSEAVIVRMMGELSRAIQLNEHIIAINPTFGDALWTQCFNYSIATGSYAAKLLNTSQHYWQLHRQNVSEPPPLQINQSLVISERLRIAFLSSDIGEHVVSRFMAPVLRNYNKDRYHVTLVSTHRRFEEKALEIVSYADSASSLHGLSIAEALGSLESIQAHVIIETNGFTRNSGIGLLAQRCAPIQCHYIGYHGTTGLDTIDYFLGDAVTVPYDFQLYYSEKIVQIPSLWMAYDSTIEFPKASSTAKRDSPVLGSFSQITKINHLTLEHWAAALNAVPDAILVIKDRGCYCSAACLRIEETLESLGVDPKRVYFIGPVASHYDHLDSYNAIDIALDTTPWSSATTAFESLGMGVPLVAICGDTTAGRMSSSVIGAAGMKSWITRSKHDFARVVAELAINYQQLRQHKASMQQQIRTGILFDEHRITNDFFKIIDSLASKQFGRCQA